MSAVIASPITTMKAYLRLAFVTVCIVISLAAMLNVFADNAEQLAKAQELACAGATCSLAQMERTPFAQTFTFRATKGTFVVRCARGAIFFGDYECKKQ